MMRANGFLNCSFLNNFEMKKSQYFHVYEKPKVAFSEQRLSLIFKHIPALCVWPAKENTNVFILINNNLFRKRTFVCISYSHKIDSLCHAADGNNIRTIGNDDL